MIKHVLVFGFSLVLLACKPAENTIKSSEPVIPAKPYMVSTAHSEATKAASDILERGGNAIDAAIAASMVLNVVEPESAGIGGGGFLLYYDANTNKAYSYDGREAAPAAIPEDIFLDDEGKALPFLEAVKGGRSVGTPALLNMFAKAYEQHGALPWPDLFEDAITVAEDGYVLTEYRYGVLNKAKHLHESPDFKRLFFDADTIKPVGSVLKNEALASTFKTIAQEGIAPFYQGVIAESIVQKVHGNSLSKGYLSLDDLAIYQAKERDLICSEYRTYKVCGIGPPSSGGIAIAQALGILSQFDLPVMKANSGQAVHLILEAEKLAYADRNHYVADSDFITVPVGELLAPSYLKERANLIDVRRAMDKTEPGVITVSDTTLASLDYERPSTTHLSIIDTKGNAVSLTSSIEYAYGSGLSVGGFLLNNQLTDFSFYSEVEGKKIANRVEGGKRPRSSMSPTLVFNADGSLKMIVGSPGGSRIITYVLKTLIQVLDWNMPIEEAVASPHYLNRNGITELENVAANEILGAELLGYGHDIIERPLKSGLHAIVIHDDGTLSGAADPRREGAVLSNQ